MLAVWIYKQELCNGTDTKIKYEGSASNRLFPELRTFTICVVWMGVWFSIIVKMMELFHTTDCCRCVTRWNDKSSKNEVLKSVILESHFYYLDSVISSMLPRSHHIQPDLRALSYFWYDCWIVVVSFVELF